MSTQWLFRTYQYGVAGHLGIENEKLAIEQMFARNCLRNALVDLERKTREQYRTIVSTDNPAAARLAELKNEIEAVRKTIKLMRAWKAGEGQYATRVRISQSPEKARLDELKAEAKKMREASKETATANRQKFSTAIKELNKYKSEAARKIHQRSIQGYSYHDDAGKTVVVAPLYHANVNEIVRRHPSVCKRALADGGIVQFHRFEGEGRVLVTFPSGRNQHFIGIGGDSRKADFDKLTRKKDDLEREKSERVAGLRGEEKRLMTQSFAEKLNRIDLEIEERFPLSRGMTETQFFTENRRFWVEPVSLQRDKNNPTVWDKSIPRAERRRRMRTVAHIRIASGEKNRPVFLTCPILMHRPLPSGVRILSAAANRRKIGAQFGWNVEFMLLLASRPETEKKGSVVAADIGWAKDSLPDADGRIRVAGVLVRNGDGQKSFSEIELPSSYTAAHMRFHEIQSIRDQHTNECFALLEAVDSINACTDDVQNALRTAIASFKARTSGQPPVRGLRRAVWMIRNGSVASENVRAILERWYERFMHLNNWLIHGRTNLRAYRKDFFRRTAYKLAQVNDTLLLDPDDLAHMARTPEPEDGTKRATGGVRVISSPAELRTSLQEAFIKSGKKILYTVHAQGTTRTCSNCGHVKENLRMFRTFSCSACGFSMDREQNATANVLALFDRQPGSFSTKLRVAKNLQLKKEEAQQQSIACAGI